MRSTTPKRYLIRWCRPTRACTKSAFVLIFVSVLGLTLLINLHAPPTNEIERVDHHPLVPRSDPIGGKASARSDDTIDKLTLLHIRGIPSTQWHKIRRTETTKSLEVAMNRALSRDAWSAVIPTDKPTIKVLCSNLPVSQCYLKSRCPQKVDLFDFTFSGETEAGSQSVPSLTWNLRQASSAGTLLWDIDNVPWHADREISNSRTWARSGRSAGHHDDDDPRRVGIDGVLVAPTIFEVLHQAYESLIQHKSTLTDPNTKTLFVYSSVEVGVKMTFYNSIAAALGNANISAIAFEDENERGVFRAFVFPGEWVPQLQIGGTLVNGPAKAVGNLFTYNLAALSTRAQKQFVIIRHPFDVPEETEELSMLNKAWHQVHIIDSFWTLHPQPGLPHYRDAMPSYFCGCDPNAADCVINEFAIRQQAATTQDKGFMFDELNRTCHLRNGMLKDNSEKSLTTIRPKLHPTELLGTWRDYRSPDSCHQKLANFRKGLPLVGFVSYPRSGNTWIRRMLERATGVLTGAIYYDKLLINAGLLGEGKIHDVLMVKDHYPFKFIHNNILDYKPQLLLLVSRNPFSAIESYYHYVHAGYVHDKTSSFDPVKWRAWVTEQAEVWYKWHKYWIDTVPAQHDIPMLRVRYEDLVSSPETELKRVLTFFGFPNINEERIRCAQQTPCKVGGACRIGKNATKIIDPYNKEETDLMFNVLGPMMARLGYVDKPKQYSSPPKPDVKNTSNNTIKKN